MSDDDYQIGFQIVYTGDPNETRDWFFTFGSVHRHPLTGAPLIKRYVKLNGTWRDTRELIITHFGTRWSHQCRDEHEAGIDNPRYGMTELPLSSLHGVRFGVIKTREQVVAGIKAAAAEPPREGLHYMPWGFPCIDGRDRQRLASWLPVSDWGALAIELKEPNAPPEPRPWTRESIVAQLRNDVEFGFEKALNRRGIWSELMWTVTRMWLWVLGHPLAEYDEYPQYGLPLFKAVAQAFDFPNPIGDAAGTEHRFSEDG